MEIISFIEGMKFNRISLGQLAENHEWVTKIHCSKILPEKYYIKQHKKNSIRKGSFVVFIEIQGTSY